MKKFFSKVAIVTGAGSGMGQAVTCLLIENGAVVIATDVNETSLAETARKCAGKVFCRYLDVTDKKAFESLRRAFRKKRSPS